MSKKERNYYDSMRGIRSKQMNGITFNSGLHAFDEPLNINKHDKHYSRRCLYFLYERVQILVNRERNRTRAVKQ